MHYRRETNQRDSSLRLLPWMAAALLVCTSLARGEHEWAASLPPRKPAWEHTQRMTPDTQYAAIIAGDLVLVGCEHNNSLIAFDKKTNAVRWTYHTNGPVRVAPVVDGPRIYVASDDGHLYCLDHGGKLQWKFRGGPAERLVIGHDRLMSTWPISARPVVHEGKLYVVAGYWPVDGIFVHALEPATGKVIWTNAAEQFRPFGQMRILGTTLFITGHNGTGAFDIATGVASSEKMPKGNADGTPIGYIESTLPTNVEGRKAPAKPSDAPSPLADDLLSKSGVSEGYALVAGLKDGALVEALLQRSRLHVIAIDADAARVNAIRERLDARGVFDGHRVSVLAADVSTVGLPPYFASLICSENDGPIAPIVKESLRPYGGTLIERAGTDLKLTRRDGPLPSSDDWAHEFGNPANTLTSRDKLVKAPLGVLWYGGLSSDGRFYYDGFVDHQSGHGLNPQPMGALVLDGRMFLQAQGVLAAVDIYTGRVMWETPLPKVYSFGGAGGGLGIHSKNHPRPWDHPEAMKAEVPPTHRARSSGFNSVATRDGVYVAAGRKALRINPIDGKVVSEWPVPLPDAEKEQLCWGGFREAGELLIATVFRPQDLADAQAGFDGNGGDWAGDRMPMAYLCAVDRNTGKLAWSRKAEWGFLNRGTCVGKGLVYAMDEPMEDVLVKWKEAGRKLPAEGPKLYALDAKTGAEKWVYKLDVLVKNLAYSEARDIVVVPNRHLMTWANGEWVDQSSKGGKLNKSAPGKMVGLRGVDGKVLWEATDSAYHNPLLILDDLLIDRSGQTFDLMSGKRALRESPLTGGSEPWQFSKSGCNHLIACDSMVTWRTAFYDLAGQTGSMKLVGMDAGCSPTLLPAGGILNIPNYGTHHKRNRMTAMALMHRPENSIWTEYAVSRPPEPVALKRAGYNFGAPGDRTTDGTLWLSVTSRDNAGIVVQPKTVRWFVPTAPTTSDDFIRTSGVIGATSIAIPTLLTPDGKAPKPVKGQPPAPARKYDVRLIFTEPEARKPGERVFGVSLEGKPVIDALDIAKEKPAGGALVKEFKDVVVEGALDIVLTAAAGETVLCGVEVVAKSQ